MRNVNVVRSQKNLPMEANIGDASKVECVAPPRLAQH